MGKLLVSDATWPAYHPDLFYTKEDVPYFREPGAIMIAKPTVNVRALKAFLEQFDPSLGFDDYLHDPVELDDATQLAKTMGQLCYLSFGPKRTDNAAAAKYIHNILESGHGSVVQHANFSFLFYGDSRSLTHELVRHGTGFCYSQVSQRYVDGTKLRFVRRPEYADPEFDELFEDEVHHAKRVYADAALKLLTNAKFRKMMDAAKLSATDRRKRVNQAARAFLPNMTEAPIGVTANVRAWRHFLNMRGSIHAEVEIRMLAVRVFQCIALVAPSLFQDISVVQLPDGTSGLQVKYPKV